MNKFTYRISIVFILCSLLFQKTFAGNGQANSTGNWTNPSTWLFNGTARVPQGGDTVNIPAGYIVTVNSVVNITGAKVILLFSDSSTIALSAGLLLSNARIAAASSFI